MSKKTLKVPLAVLVLAVISGLLLVMDAAKPVPAPPPAVPPATPDGPGKVPAGGIVGQIDGGSLVTGGKPSTTSASVPGGKPASTPASRASRITSSKPKPGDAFMTVDGKQYPVREYEPLMTPNDPSATQWWISNAKLDQAWDIPAGSHQTTLAIIDSGFALDHEEFANRWHTNQGESGATTSENAFVPNCTSRSLQLDKSCNGLDDDDNGFTDDYRGWDFTGDDNSVQAGQTNSNGSGATHGTRVAGVAAATGNNGKGIAGVDWQTKILPLQALDDDGYGNTWGVGQAILYAVAQGADVISLSLGSTLPDDFVHQAVHTAMANGSVVVAAAGNDGCDCMVYPARYPEVVAVGALATNSSPASFSSYGDNLDILAPGTSMTTTSWAAGNGSSAYASGVNGTSFATPLISGLIARLLSQQPTARPLQLIAALTENTNRLSLASSPRSDTLGYGTADAYGATSRMTTPRDITGLAQFTPASLGAFLTPSQPSEPTGSFRAVSCLGIPGSVPLMELSKANAGFFTLSLAEAWTAQQQGYNSRLAGYVCLSQPHDSGDNAAYNLSLFKEFRNILENIP